MTNIRSVMGSMDLDQLLSNRDEINAKLLRVVDAAAEPWGLKMTRIEIKDINPPRDLVEAMGRQMKAEREKRASILEAEGERQSEILKAEGEKQGLILQAEGRREAAFRDAEAREREAEAEAKATQMVSEAISNGDVQAINYFVANKYVEALGEMAKSPNQKILFLPMEATSILGALGGIGEIAREAFGGEAPAGRAALRFSSQHWARRRGRAFVSYIEMISRRAWAMELACRRAADARLGNPRARHLLPVVRRFRADRRHPGAVRRPLLAG